MAVLKPRNRLVYFRVSEDEFQQFTTLCQNGGARSISDLARDAMSRLLAEADVGKNGDSTSPQVTMLDRLIAEVSEQLRQLTSLQERAAAINSRPADPARVEAAENSDNSQPERSN